MALAAVQGRSQGELLQGCWLEGLSDLPGFHIPDGKETLDPSLSVFIKAKVLHAQPEGAKPESGTTYKLNTGFKTKKVKMNLNIGIKSEQKAEAEDTHKTIEEDRKLLMQVRSRRSNFIDNLLIGYSRPLCVS